VYPSRSNSGRNPAAYGSNGPDTRAQHGFTMTFSSLGTEKAMLNPSHDYADLTGTGASAANGSRPQVGIIPESG
jgi:hypothetical protein